jgi:hypothetical protein
MPSSRRTVGVGARFGIDLTKCSRAREDGRYERRRRSTSFQRVQSAQVPSTFPSVERAGGSLACRSLRPLQGAFAFSTLAEV